MAAEAWALPQSRPEFLLLLRTLNVESIGDEIKPFLHVTHLGSDLQF